MTKYFAGALLLGSLFSGQSASGHRQHFGWSSISWNDKSSVMEIEHRVHEHDAAKLLSKLTQNETDITDVEAQARFALYVANHFSIYTGEKRLQPNLLGAELHGHYILVYQELPMPVIPARLGFESTILMDLFDDQIHIVNLKVAEDITTYEFNRFSERKDFIKTVLR